MRLNKEDEEIDDPHVEFNGELFSIGLVRRDDGEGDWMVQLYSEDDGNKFLVEEFAGEWIDDLQKQVDAAKRYMMDAKGLHE